jgi:hypothetical protein
MFSIKVIFQKFTSDNISLFLLYYLLVNLKFYNIYKGIKVIFKEKYNSRDFFYNLLIV